MVLLSAQNARLLPVGVQNSTDCRRLTRKSSTSGAERLTDRRQPILTRVHGLGIGSMMMLGLQAGNVSGQLYGSCLAVRVWKPVLSVPFCFPICERIGVLMVALQYDVTAAQATPMFPRLGSPVWGCRTRGSLLPVQNLGGLFASIRFTKWSGHLRSGTSPKRR